MELLGFLAYLLTKFAAYAAGAMSALAGLIRAAKEGSEAACSMDSCVC